MITFLGLILPRIGEPGEERIVLLRSASPPGRTAMMCEPFHKMTFFHCGIQRLAR